jgi:hypothetical protein
VSGRRGLGGDLSLDGNSAVGSSAPAIGAGALLDSGASLVALNTRVDVCDDSVYAPRAFDVGFLTRGADDEAVPDQAGPFDLGLHERGGREGLFFDGFESGDALAWSQVPTAGSGGSVP